MATKSKESIMTKTETWSVMTRLIASLRNNGSWAGETHVQKAAYILKHLTGVPLDFEFILYKHGPFSFGLRDELAVARDSGAITVEPQLGYGAKLKASRIYSMPSAPDYQAEIDFIGRVLGDKDVANLERIGTALLFDLAFPTETTSFKLDKLRERKPHISSELATNAMHELEALKTQLQESAAQFALA
jgi:hypothetical protein